MNFMDNISKLLCSQESDNLELIVELIAGVEVVDKTLLSYLLPIYLKHSDGTLRERAGNVFQQYASNALQTHVEKHKKVLHKPYLKTMPLYLHPEIHFFEAVLSEKMMEFHLKRAIDQPFPDFATLYLVKSNWKKSDSFEGLSKMTFLDTVVVQHVSNFNFKAFDDALKSLKIKVLTFEKTLLPADELSFWGIKTLEKLRAIAPNIGYPITIPPDFTTSLDWLRLQGGYDFTGVEHLLGRAAQFKHFLIREDAKTWKNQF
jgi:hypothetical protein